jgi:hypothetical protein
MSDGIADGFAASMRDGATWVIKTTVGWWIDVPAIDLSASPVDTIRGYVLWIAVVLATAGVIWQGIVLTLSRRPEPVLTVLRGLCAVALWSAIGIIGPAAALGAGDSFSTWVLGEAAGGSAADRLVVLTSLEPVKSAGAVILLGLIMMLAGLIQALFMMFREGTVVILAGLTVLAAAGQFTGATRTWLSKVLGWMLALICYKPAAALVYASALTLTGESADVRTVFVGLSMMLISIVALPALMRLFTWTTGSLGASAGGSGVAALAGLGAAALQAKALAGGGGGAPSPAEQAGHIKSDMTTPSSPAGATTAPPPSANATVTPAASSTAAGGGAAAAPTAGAAATAGPAAVGVAVAAEGAKAVVGVGNAMASTMTKDGR